MISKKHIARRDSMEGHLLYHKPLEYWNKVRAVLISHLAITNETEVLVELEIWIGQEKLFYSADRSAYLKVDGQTEGIRDRSMLSILASTYEALSRELYDPEWTFFTKSHKRRKMLKREARRGHNN